MKKCDLHIHTIATPSDASFIFALDVLENYVRKIQLDVKCRVWEEIGTPCNCIV